jgi:hypothetical protein
MRTCPQCRRQGPGLSQASGPIDQTNLFGHVAIAFTGLGSNSFGISWMGSNQGFPTYHNSSVFKGDRAGDWQGKLKTRKSNGAFPNTREEISIKTSKSDDSHHENPMSEDDAFEWWRDTQGSAIQTSKGLDFQNVRGWDGKDCADVVMAALKAAGSENIASVRTITRPIITPQAVIQYAKSLRDKSA